jgi:mRNA interferase MazF
MTSFEFGDVVLVPFPFTNQRTNKKRPAVVSSSPVYNTERPDLIVMAVTSQTATAPSGFGEAGVTHWREAGLLKPSVFKPLLATIERPLVLRRLGKLQPADRDILRGLLDRILGP